MNIVIAADVYPPLRSSGAVQLRDLSIEFLRQGHDVTVMVSSPDLKNSYELEEYRGVRVLRLKTLPTRDQGYVKRAIHESLLSFSMWSSLQKSPLRDESWDAIVWYSPTIFLGPFVGRLKSANVCPAYLIIRDIFPEWAADMGLMSKGLPYWYFKAVARYQYSVANIIGVQTPGNRVYFRKWETENRKLEVLYNWLDDTPAQHCSIQVSDTVLRNRKIFVYAGNMGVAQGMDILIRLAESYRENAEIGFLFVGRGSEAKRLRSVIESKGLCNTLFFDEIDPDEILGLYAQCSVGMLSLDPRHETHNIPGKFLSYMQAGLPVLASVNPGNDIVELIQSEGVGAVTTTPVLDSLQRASSEILENLGGETHSCYRERCRSLFQRMFSPGMAVKQICEAVGVTPRD